MRRSVILGIGLAILAGSSAVLGIGQCNNELDAVCVHEGANFQDGRRPYHLSDSDFGDDIFDNGHSVDNSVSSMEVRIGYGVVLYERANYGGAGEAFEATLQSGGTFPNLGAWSDRASSMYVYVLPHIEG